MAIPEMNHILKFRRAREHLDKLEVASREWVDSAHCSIWYEPDPAIPDKLLIYAKADPVPLEPFSLIIGDVLQNFRSSLDHLIFELSEIHSGPLTDEQKSIPQYPIIGKVTDFPRHGDRRIKFLHPEAQEIVKKMQPYSTGDKFDTDPLWVLNEFTNTDKHRLLHVTTIALQYVIGMKIENVTPPKPQIVEEMGVHGGRVEGQTIIGWMKIRAGVPYDQVKVHPTLDVAFTDGPLIARSVCETLERIHWCIHYNVFKCLEPFLQKA